MIADYLRRVGFLRAVLMLITVLLAFLSLFAGGEAETSGWPLVTTLLAPVFFVIFVFVLSLDMLMTLVFMSGSSAAERRRFTMIFRSEALLLVILLASWTPYMLTFTQP
jgi:hypothetical protein